MAGTKTCTHCGREKLLEEFYKRSSSKDGLMTWCKTCYSEWAAEYYKKNKDKIQRKHKEYNSSYEVKERIRARTRTEEYKNKRREYEKTHKDIIKRKRDRYYANHRDAIIAHNTEYRRKNPDKAHQWAKTYREKHKEQISEYHKKYINENREKHREHIRNRLHTDELFKVKEQTRNMIRYALRSSGHRKESSTKDILGCELDFFFEYLKDTWAQRYGEPWSGQPFHIDHIIPLATAKTEEDVIKLCHYTNLQMLTPSDNRDKWDRLDWE